MFYTCGFSFRLQRRLSYPPYSDDLGSICIKLPANAHSGSKNAFLYRKPHTFSFTCRYAKPNTRTDALSYTNAKPNAHIGAHAYRNRTGTNAAATPLSHSHSAGNSIPVPYDQLHAAR